MIGIVLAAALPPLLFWTATLARKSPVGHDVHRAIGFWFAPLALLWFAPCWMTGRTPAPLDYLTEDVVPWEIRGYESANPLLSDSVLQFLPWRESIKQSVLHGALPFLDRFNGSGSVLWANPQSGATFPLTWLGLPFSVAAWPLFAAMTKLLVALTGTYLFLRREDRSHQAAIAGAVAYAFCAFNIAFALFPHTNVTALLPWVLLGIAACEERRGAAMFAVVLALAMAGGHPESVLHVAFIAVPYAAHRLMRIERDVRRRFVAHVVAGGVIALLLAAPALVPFAAYLPVSERLSRLLRQPEILLTPPPTLQNLSAFFAGSNLLSAKNPNLLMNFNEVATQYAGLATFALALAAAILDARRQRFWIAMWLVASFFAFESPLARMLTARIPIVNVTVHGRLRFVIAFCIAVLAARAIDLLDRRVAAIVAVTTVLAALISWRTLPGLVAIGAAALTVVAALRPELRRLVPLFMFADLAALLMTYNSPVDPSSFFRRTPALQFLDAHRGPHRVAGISNGLRPNTSSYLAIESIGFHDPMAFEPYGTLLASAGYDRRTYFNVFNRVPPRALLNALGVRYVIAPPQFTTNELPCVYSGPDAAIFANPAALPRVFALTPGASGAVVDYERNGETIDVRSPVQAQIATSEVALPGWRLTINGERRPIVVLRHAFVGFLAPPGVSRIELRYVPRGFELGCVLGLAGLAGLAGLGYRPRR